MPPASSIVPFTRCLTCAPRIEEYKVNGKVYMVKVIPPKPFPPYYLEDKGGTGRFTEVPQTAAEHLSVPHWVIFRW